MTEYTQDALFPESAVQTEGYAQPEPHETETGETDFERLQDAA